LNVTIAEADPLGPVAVTVSVLAEGIVAGAVYRPTTVTVPYVAATPSRPGP